MSETRTLSLLPAIWVCLLMIVWATIKTFQSAEVMEADIHAICVEMEACEVEQP